jgi:nitroimidazol reductase NimA-like FMN-containing flavoprotein (pyridoxamine 5'-phosphate oxidase superfamily)
MRDRVKAFLKEKDLCVLATTREGRPHCSLMAYVADEEAEWIYMVTYRTTTKYKNLLSNEQVSLLVDNRCEGLPANRGKIQALTVHGVFHAVEKQETRKQILKQLLKRHPHMREFLSHPEAEIISVRAHSFLFLDGISDAHRMTLTP